MTFLTRQQFNHLYGERIYAIALNLEKQHQRSMKTNQHISFLKQCKREMIIPQGMYLYNVTGVTENDHLLRQTMNKMRNNTLNKHYRNMTWFKREIRTQEQILKTYMMRCQPQRQFHNDLNWMNTNDGKKKEKMHQRHERKLEKLRKRGHHTPLRNNEMDTSNVINLSMKELTTQQTRVLSKGLKFVPTSTSIRVVDIIANAECSLNHTPMITKQAAIAEITTFVNRWRKPTVDNMSHDERRAMKQLKNMNELIIIQADKGGKTVVMDRTEYINKIETKLNDESTYEKVPDPTKIVKKKIAELTNRLFKANRINQSTKYELTSVDNIAKIRGQPKIHKKDYPMRIVTCSRNTITSPISRFAFSFIRQLRETIKNNISNTTKFVEEITKVRLEKEERFTSLDVEDLFTNIPVTRAIDIAINKLGSSEKFCESTLTKTDLKQILLTALNNNYVQFNGNFYKQKHGLPMGNTLSPILADLYMDDYIEKKMMKVNEPGRLWRYVDDFFIITKMEEHEVQTYVKELNKIKGKIRFTYEYEKNGTINFLDTHLTRKEDGNVGTRWFRKETAADRLLNYDSQHQQSTKVNIIRNMTTRIMETTKEKNEQKQDLDRLKTMLIKSNYPRHIIEKNIENALITSTPEENQNNAKKEEKYCITLPYVKGIEVLRRKLADINIKLYFSYPSKIQSTCTDSIENESKSIVYQMECTCGSIYNGETKVGLRERMKQHTRTINNKDNKSEIVEHHKNNNHRCKFNPNEAFIIEQEVNRKKRRIKEAIHSIVNSSINHHDDIDRLWLPLLYASSTTIKSKTNTKRRINRSREMGVQDGDSGTEEEDNSRRILPVSPSCRPTITYIWTERKRDTSVWRRQHRCRNVTFVNKQGRVNQ